MHTACFLSGFPQLFSMRYSRRKWGVFVDKQCSALYTIGYSGFSDAEGLTRFLNKRGIDVLIDVRSSPYSGHFPQFNKENLQLALHDKGIYYRNYAEPFGARQDNPAFYVDGRLDFERFTDSERFLDGVAKIENSIEKGYVLTLMCAEKDPIICHRAIMISRVFHEAGYKVCHLRADMADETHEMLEKRLVEMYFPPSDQLDLLSIPMTFHEQLKKAYRFQNDKIGFRESDLHL